MSVAPGGEQIGDLVYYLKVLLKYKWSILFFVILSLAATRFLLSRVQPLYEVSTVIQIDPEKLDPLDNKAKYFQVWLDPEYFNTQLKLLTNPALGKQVVETLGLDKNPNFISDRPTTLTAAFFDLLSTKDLFSKPDSVKIEKAIPDSQEIGSSDESEKLEGLSGYVMGNLQVFPVPKTRLVTISYRHHDPKMAQQIVNTVAQTFIKNNLNYRTSSSQNTSAFLNKRVAGLQMEINTAEQELINYGKEHEIVSLTGEENTVVERLTTLNRQLLEAEAARKEAEAIYKLVQDGTTPDSIPEVQSSPTIRTLQEKLSELRLKRADILSVYTEDWPELGQVNQTIAQIEKDIRAEKLKIVSGIETRYRAALGREKLLHVDFEMQKGTTLKQNESAINYRIKQQEIEIKKELYKTILSQLKESDIAASSDLNNISLITPAPLPKGAVSPRSSWNLTLALLLSFIGSGGLAFIREYLNNKINSVEDVDRFVNLPTLGMIPAFKPELTRSPIAELLPGAELPPGTTQTESLSDSTELVVLSAFNTPDSNVAEAYRHLRTSLILSPLGQNNKIILVTSGQPGEGKTTTAINIAVSLAHTGARTVLIEADLRKPSFFNFFKVKENCGLSQYLSGYIPMGELLRESEVPNLRIIPVVGARPIYPAELLGSMRMINLLKDLSETNDYIIIDTPPILPFADAAILSAHADSVLLVVNSKNSRREVVKRACRLLQDVGANLLGVVLNNIDEQESSYGYNYQGYRNYRESADSIVKRAISTLKDFRGGTNTEQDKEDGVGWNLKIEIKPTVDKDAEAPGNGRYAKTEKRPEVTSLSAVLESLKTENGEKGEKAEERSST